AGKKTEQYGAPSQKCANRGEEFQVAATHRFARNLELMHDAGNFGEIVEHKFIAFYGDAIVMKVQCRISISVIVDLCFVALEQQSIFFACEMVAPQTLFAADHEIGVVTLSFPGKRRRRVETNSFFSKSDFARLQNDQKNQITKNSREQRTNTRSDSRICVHQSRCCQAGNDSRDYPADRHPVWNDEMLEIDKCPDD